MMAEDIKNGAAIFERIPYAQQSGLSKGSKVLCTASIICRGCPRTESEARQMYDTNDLIGEACIQEQIVETWARLSGTWIENPEEYLDNLCHLQDNGVNVIDADCRLNVSTLDCGGKYIIPQPHLDFSKPCSEWIGLHLQLK